LNCSETGKRNGAVRVERGQREREKEREKVREGE
jgi:hypothetical protein